MKIFLAADHNGYKTKESIKRIINIKKYEVEDLGSYNDKSVDYPEYAFSMGRKIVSTHGALGILICGTGIGMSIACNKVKGIRCARVCSKKDIYYSRYHNNANVIAISKNVSPLKLKAMINTFLNTPFSKEERHLRRVKEIDDYND